MAFHADRVHDYLTTHDFKSEAERQAFAKALDRHSWFDKRIKRKREPSGLEKRFENIALKFSQALEKDGITLVQCGQAGVDLSLDLGKHAVDFSKRTVDEETQGRAVSRVEAVLLFRIKNKWLARRVVKALEKAKIASTPAVEKVDEKAVEFSIDASHARNPAVWEIIERHLKQ